jgi:glycosyltransferase involved in cell wall biosynthesis
MLPFFIMKKMCDKRSAREVVLFVSRDKGWKTELPLKETGLVGELFYATGGIRERLKEYCALVLYAFKAKRIGIVTDTTQFAGIPVLIAWLLGASYLVRLRGDSLTESKDSWKIVIYPLEKYVTLKLASGIITVSDYLKDRIKAEYPEKHIEVVPTPVVPDRKEFDNPSRCKTILVAMNFHFERKIGRLIKDLPVVDRILDRFPWITLKIIGDGRLRRSIELAVSRTRNRERICVAGAEPTIWPALNESICLYHPSELDAYPSVILEAQMAGRPAMAYDSCGMREQIRDGIDGYLYSDTYQLESKFTQLLGNSELIERLGLEGRKKAKEGNLVEKVGENLYATINDMLEIDLSTSLGYGT